MNRERLNIWSLVIGVGIFIALVILSLLIINPFKAPKAITEEPTASFLVIPAPSLTPTTDPILLITPTVYREIIDGISIDSVVKVSGTEGSGLRFRSGPGTSNPSQFVAMDDELFEVKDGPQEADSYVWWYLVSPYDEKRSGWAAASYLAIVESNQ